MQRADRLAAVGEMAAGIAHEINNALAAIFGQTVTGRAAQRRRAARRAGARRRAGAAHRRDRAGRARLRPPAPAAPGADRPRRAGGEDARAGAPRSRPPGSAPGDRLRRRPAAGQADPQQLQQVLLNLFGNAIQAMAGRADAWLRVEVRGDDDQLALRVSDGGPGIAAEILPRIFDPFFSTKSEGSGLGLSVSYAIARAHGGDLRVDEPAGARRHLHAVLPSARRRPPTWCWQRALLVDDDPEVAEALTAMLAKEGSRVVARRHRQGGLARSSMQLGRGLSRRPPARSLRPGDLSPPRRSASRPGAARRLRHRRRLAQREPPAPGAAAAADPRQALHAGRSARRPAPAARPTPPGGVSAAGAPPAPLRCA